MPSPRFVLSGGVAAVTGAASGIGRATAVALARRGCALALADRDARNLSDAAAQARWHGVRVSTHAFDVTDAEAREAFVQDAVAEHGRLTVLVNNAGASLAGRADEVCLDEVRWLFEVNFFALVALTLAALPHLRREREAHIVNLSSLFGLIAPAEQAAYAATKFAVRGFSEALRHELAGTSVGVTVVHPGGVRTGIARATRYAASADPDALRAKSEAFERAFLKTPPWVAGEAIARAVERRQGRLLVASGARLAAALQRLAPAGYWRLMDGPYQKLSSG